MKRSAMGWLAACFFIAMAIFPQSVYSGARRGLSLWAEVLVPSMLPFFMLAEILMASGLLNKLGFLLSPVMEPLFHLPGTAGLGLALGYTSGFPMGAVISSRLYSEGFLDHQQASRLLAFTNNASPGFVLTSLAAGMLNAPATGKLILFCHYGANFIYGIILGLLPAGRKSQSKSLLKNDNVSSLKINENQALSPGALLSESIRISIQNMLSLGGFVVIFSAGLQLLNDLKLLWLLAAAISRILPPSLNQGPLAQALAAGLFEMTLGLYQTTQVSIDLTQKVIFCLLIMGWSGFSIQAQVSGIVGLSRLDLRYYFAGRLFQPLISVAIFLLSARILQLGL